MVQVHGSFPLRSAAPSEGADDRRRTNHYPNRLKRHEMPPPRRPADPQSPADLPPKREWEVASEDRPTHYGQEK